MGSLFATSSFLSSVSLIFYYIHCKNLSILRFISGHSIFEAFMMKIALLFVIGT
jgi:hypothetical protein